MRDTQQDSYPEISKSQRKRDLAALRQLGQALLEFSDEELQQLGLPEALLDALRSARSISARGAHKRQLQYIGKLLRDIDTAAISAAVEERGHQHDLHTRDFHQLESLRDRLIAGDDTALDDTMARFPLADRQHLRKLARQAHGEHEQHQPPRAARLLFRYLRELQEEPGY